MKTWIIASILLGMLVIGGFAVVSALSDNAKDSTTIVSKSTSCSTCGNEIYLSLTRLNHSKSGKFFCDKSCQTKWRNKEYSGIKSKLWKDGISTYRDVIINSNVKKICLICNFPQEI
jgi:hypothetical protein